MKRLFAFFSRLWHTESVENIRHSVEDAVVESTISELTKAVLANDIGKVVASLYVDLRDTRDSIDNEPQMAKSKLDSILQALDEALKARQ